jgi:hypothetical protein
MTRETGAQAEAAGSTEPGEPKVEPGGPKVEAPSEECFRQVHPNFIVRGRLTEMAFRLKSRDYGLLSISLSSKTSAATAHAVYTSTIGQDGKPLKSAAVYAVTVAECSQVRLDVYEDPKANDPAHGSIDLRHVLADEDQRKTKQIQLKDFAEARGCVFTP